jgi:hypothetical protein
MKIKRLDTSKDELSGKYPAAYVFLTGNKAFFDEDLNFYQHLDMTGLEPGRAGGFYYDGISIEKVKALWDAEYREKAAKAKIRPMSYFYFDRGKTARQAFQAWYFRGCKCRADRQKLYRKLNEKE